MGCGTLSVPRHEPVYLLDVKQFIQENKEFGKIVPIAMNFYVCENQARISSCHAKWHGARTLEELITLPNINWAHQVFLTPSQVHEFKTKRKDSLFYAGV